ncbi:MAG: hypothetical protein ACK51Q_08455 [Betaproteobacteria bacterium]|jgi:hypothetical protein
MTRAKAMALTQMAMGEATAPAKTYHHIGVSELVMKINSYHKFSMANDQLLAVLSPSSIESAGGQ